MTNLYKERYEFLITDIEGVIRNLDYGKIGKDSVRDILQQTVDNSLRWTERMTKAERNERQCPQCGHAWREQRLEAPDD